MVSIDTTAEQTTSSGSYDVNAGRPTTPTKAESRVPGLNCAFQSQAHDELRAVSSTHYPADIQQCSVLSDDEECATVIGTEYVVTEKIYSLLLEDEKLLWHAHKIDALLSSSGAQEVASTYGRVFRSPQDSSANVLPAALSRLLIPSSDGLKKRQVQFSEDEVKLQNSSEGSRNRNSTGGADVQEFENGKEDKYLNDAVHRPVVHHRSSHVPALTDRMPDDGQFLSDTLSSRF